MRGDELGELLREGTLSDIIIVVKDREFPAHRAVLAARSTYFFSMLTVNIEEAQKEKIVIPDVDVNAFSKFLEFVYTRSIVNWNDHELELLALSDRYQVDSLKIECEARVGEIIQNVRGLLALVTEVTLSPLYSGVIRQTIFKIVKNRWEEVRPSPEWNLFHNSNPLIADCLFAVLDV